MTLVPNEDSTAEDTYRAHVGEAKERTRAARCAARCAAVRAVNLEMLSPWWKSRVRSVFCLVIFAGLALSATSQVLPRIFYSDLDGGPNTGGENNNGVYVTIYGHGLGSSQGSSRVTVGGGAPAQYKVWCGSCWGGVSGTEYDKVTVQLGSSAASGNIVLTTSAGASNGIPFTVRSGNIYFVSNSGSDGAAGSFAAPWATLTYARDTMLAGDTIYARAGSYLTMDDGSGYSTCMKLGSGNGGSSSGSNAMIAYPGESVSLGDTNNCGFVIRSQGTQTENYWTFAGFSTIIGNQITINSYSNHDWRIIGNGWGGSGMTAPNANGQSGCLDIGGDQDGTSYNYWVYGNNIIHCATNNSPGSVTALQHGVYFSQQIHTIQFAWNVVAYVYGGRCIQEHVNDNSSADDASSYDMHIHDNFIHDCQDDGIVMTTVNPSLGTVELYNNVIYNAGIGPANAENSGAWNCMNIQGWQNGDVSRTESGIVNVYGNTMYACGTWANPPYNESSGGFLWEAGNTSTKGVRFENNIIQLTTGPASGYPYLSAYGADGSLCSSNCALVQGSSNIFVGNGGNPTDAELTSSINSNPLFVNASAANFHLLAGSPAATAGTPTSQTTDLDGVALPQGSGYPIGAYALPIGGVGTPGVSVTINPTSSSLDGSQTQQFSASVSGTANTSVTWSASPLMGTVSNSGLYTAPAVVPSRQTVLVTATSLADSTKSATASVSLIPVAVSLSGSVSVSASETNQFIATVTGTTQTGVTWTMNPQVGVLSASGLYQAPASISTQQTITVTATSIADPTKSASATVTLLSSNGISVSVNPETISLVVGQTQQFTATVYGTAQTGVTWTTSRQVGRLSATGLYSPPLSVLAQETLTVTATSTADPTKSASATITLLSSGGLGQRESQPR